MKSTAPARIEDRPEDIEFWTFDTNSGRVDIDPLELNRLLEALGFMRLDEGLNHRFVRVVRGSVIEETKRTFIIDAFFNHLATLPEQLMPGLNKSKIERKVMRSLSSIFQEDKLLRLGASLGGVPPFQKDTPAEKYMFFSNGFLRITKSAKEFLPYNDLKGSVWQDEILPREWMPSVGYKNGPFYKFMRLVAGSDDRMKQFMIWTGYYLHHPPDGKRRALVLTDSSLSSGLEANGRTGKSLYCKGLGYALAADPSLDGIFLNISARDFDPNYKFKYQAATTKTRVVVLNDLKPGFNLETLYNDVTEGMGVNQKGLAPFRIFPKLLLTTNRTVANEGESSKDRFQEMEFTNYFSTSRTPLDEFGHWFFTDWTPGQWGQFYSLMAECAQMWLAAGDLPRPTVINLLARKMVEQTSPEFVEWFIDRKFEFAQYPKDHRHKEEDKYYSKRMLFDEFTDMFTDYKKRLTMRKFSSWISNFTKFNESFLPYDKDRDQYKNGNDFYVCFRQNKT